MSTRRNVFDSRRLHHNSARRTVSPEHAPNAAPNGGPVGGGLRGPLGSLAARLLLLLLACRCTPALPLPEEEEEEPAPELGESLTAESEAPALCITIAPLVWDTYPGVGDALLAAGDAWGIGIDVRADCRRRLDIGEIPSTAAVPPLARAWLYDCRDGRRDCDPLSRGVRLNYRVAGTPWLIDRPAEDCHSGYLLQSVLIHELGHVLLGVGHDPDSDARSAVPYECDLVAPTDEERELAAERLGR